MEYKFKVSSKNYYKSLLTILNFNLKLSDLELDIIATLLNNGMTEVDSAARDILIKTLNKSKFNINNYIIRLKSKRIFTEDKSNNRLYLNPGITDIVKDGKISFEFTINDNN